jgi:hypothetical protein
MTSQLNVDAIVDKAGSGGSNVKMANTSTYVSDGGSATQNTVQGLVKSWVQHAGSTPLDSFNISGLTDNGIGNFTLAFSNVMGNALYSGTFGGASAGTIVSAYNDGQFTASGFNMTCFGYNGASLADPDHATGSIAGDLA